MASPALNRVTLQRNERSHELHLNQVTVEHLRRLFQVCTCVHFSILLVLLPSFTDCLYRSTHLKYGWGTIVMGQHIFLYRMGVLTLAQQRLRDAPPWWLRVQQHHPPHHDPLSHVRLPQQCCPAHSRRHLLLILPASARSLPPGNA